jgi:uncharacterized protein (TIGR00290 family)
MKQKTFCSWSGGKDSCLSLYRAIQENYEIKTLMTMCREDGLKSRSHGLSPEILTAQAKSLDLDLILCSATWDDYESVFKTQMSKFEREHYEAGIFGDIDLEPHKTWVLDALAHTEMIAHHPIWQESRRSLIEEFIDLGFEAIIVTVNTDLIDASFLGKTFNHELISELESVGVDACGENGEFHTVVTNGPIFKQPLNLKISDTIKKDQYLMLNLELASN